VSAADDSARWATSVRFRRGMQRAALRSGVARIVRAVPNPPSPIRAIDLFCGAGGLSRGLRDAGFELVAAADQDPDSCATFRRNFPDTVLIQGDLTAQENHAAVVDVAGSDRRLDLLVGGPPCQAFSQIHNHDRLLEDPRNRLYREFVRILNELRPRA